MDYVINVQGLRNLNNKFITKESYWKLDFKAPHNFTELIGIKRSNEYISIQYHSVRCHKGDISMEQLQFYLQQVAKVAIRVFTRGQDNWRYLETVIFREVVNVEEMYALTFQELKKNYPDRFIQDINNTRDCAVNQAYLLRKWLHSIAEDITQDSAQKFSDASYCKLHSCYFCVQEMSRDSELSFLLVQDFAIKHVLQEYLGGIHLTVDKRASTVRSHISTVLWSSQIVSQE
ncbi:hypothetical protein TSAR_012076 [Trichomalopsis sarcophagae]|uniref:Uncharacterized protein n=1 Tax=Trichomalopsis sarcophagae TaxID=543379 RepID=A0A232EUI6_9HYME|nr:hypothetical protein TSAR_012076 [Trichomalopsis sarcophagae]